MAIGAMKEGEAKMGQHEVPTELVACPRCKRLRPLKASTLRNYKGVIPICVQCNGRDISARKNAERKARPPHGYANQWGWWRM